MKKSRKDTVLSPNVNVIMKGRAVIIKPISEKEITKRYISWLNRPQINKFLEVRHKSQTKRDVIDYINRLRSKRGNELFAIFTKKEGIHIGNVAITEYDSNNQGIATYSIIIGDIRAQMLGLGGEVETIMVEYIFRDPNIRRIQEGAIADNHKACRVLESLGFIKEGTLREHALLASGKISDIHMYGMLREEWISNRNKFRNILKSVEIVD